MLINKEKRDALMERLNERWKLAAEASRTAHIKAWRVGQMTVERAFAGAQNNALQVIVIDVETLLRGVDPTFEAARPLDNTFPAALAAAQAAIGAYLDSFKTNVDDATRLMLLTELETTLATLDEYVPPAMLEALMAGAGVDGGE